jgi:hypothetical protein
MTAAIDAPQQGANDTDMAGDAMAGEAGPPAHPAASGVNLGWLRIRHLKSTMKMGWGHDEGDSASRTLFALSSIYEGDRRTAFRIVAGRHSLWFFF